MDNVHHLESTYCTNLNVHRFHMTELVRHHIADLCIQGFRVGSSLHDSKTSQQNILTFDFIFKINLTIKSFDERRIGRTTLLL